MSTVGRAEVLRKLFDSTLDGVIAECNYDIIAGCFPSVAKADPAMLKNAYDQMVHLLHSYTKDEFAVWMEQDQVDAKLMALDRIMSGDHSQGNPLEIDLKGLEMSDDEQSSLDAEIEKLMEEKSKALKELNDMTDSLESAQKEVSEVELRLVSYMEAVERLDSSKMAATASKILEYDPSLADHLTAL